MKKCMILFQLNLSEEELKNLKVGLSQRKSYVEP